MTFQVSDVSWERLISVLCLMALLWSATPALVAAQANEELQERPGLSRAALLEAARRAAVEDVVEPERATVETGLHRFAQFSGFLADIQDVGRGFHFDGGDFPSGAGFAYGLGFTDLAVGSIYADADRPNRVDVKAVAAYSTSNYAQLSGDLSLRNLGGSPITLDVRGTFFEHPEEDFFGLGPGSEERNRTSYLLRSTEVGAELTWHPTGGLRVGGGVAYLTPSIGSGRDSRFPSTDELFDPSALSGFQAQPDFLRLDALVAYDGRDDAGLPRAGGYYAARFTDFRDQDFDSFDFRRIDVDLQQYVPWFQGYRVLAFRAAATMTEASRAIRTLHPEFPHWSEPALVTLRDRAGDVDVVGMGEAERRPPDSQPDIASAAGTYKLNLGLASFNDLKDERHQKAVANAHSHDSRS